MTLPYDEIHVEDLEVFAHHGVFPEENRLGQKFVISLVLYVDTRPAGTADRLEQSVHYGEVSAFLTDYMHQNTFQRIETAAEHMAEEVLLHYPLVKGLTLELKKPWAPVGLPLKTVSVKITRFWHTAYIALGSNLGDKKGYLDGAVKALDEVHGCKVESVSSYLNTKPYGGVEQDDFLNACLKLKTFLPPHELLDRLHDIEQAAHRERLIHWGPRTLDLDIIFYDDLIYSSEDLVIPHVDMENRYFVLKPLSELAPNFRHPITHKTVAQMLAELPVDITEGSEA